MDPRSRRADRRGRRQVRDPSGRSAPSRAAIAVISCCACASDTPGFSRPTVSQPEGPALSIVRARLQRDPRVHVAFGELKRRGQHPDDGVRDRIQPERLTDGAPLPAEFPLPETVAEHDDGGLFFGRGEQSSHDGLGLNDVKELRRGSDDAQLLGIANAGHAPPA